MSTEEVQETMNAAEANNEVETQDESGSKLSYEQLEAELARTRKEAASRRVSGKEKDEEIARKLKEHDEWKLSQLSEVDRLKAEKAEIEEEMKKVKAEKLRSDVAAKAGLTDPDLVPLVKGETEAEMLAHAKVLAGKQAKNGGTPDRFRAGDRGKPVGANTEKTPDQILRDMLSGKS